jgi:hypothetical protein
MTLGVAIDLACGKLHLFGDDPDDPSTLSLRAKFAGPNQVRTEPHFFCLLVYLLADKPQELRMPLLLRELMLFRAK